MTAGVIALIVVLVVVTPLGLIWRRRQGQLRAPRPGSARAPAPARPPAPPSGPATNSRSGPAQDATRGRLTAADLRQDLGPRATLVQFSSAFCAPCRATRQVLAAVGGLGDGGAFVG